MQPIVGLLAQQASDVFYQFSRLQSMTEWWHWLVILLAVLAIVSYVVVMYRFDSVELPRAVCWCLILLRVAAFAGILVYFLDLEKRSQQQVVKNSRVLLLVDTSQSMGVQDADSTTVPAGPSRVDHVIAELSQGTLVSRLRRDHDVVAYRFDETAQPVQIAAFPKLTRTASGEAAPDAAAQRLEHLQTARWIAAVAGVLLLVALVSAVVYWLFGRQRQGEEATSWALLVSIVMLIAAAVVFAVASLQDPELEILAVIGWENPSLEEDAADETTDDQPSAGNEDSDDVEDQPPQEVQWAEALVPNGKQTRIGDNLRFLLNKERGEPVAGIVLFTDGVNNAGVDVVAAIRTARDAAIPIYPVGLGSEQAPVNVRVVDLEAPKRVYPGDRFTMTGYLQAYGLDGRSAKVELVSAPAGSENSQEELFEQEQRVRLGADGEVLPLNFEVTPEVEGTRQYRLRVVPPSQDLNPRDNQQNVDVQIVERQNRVLLFAGGPSREYRFLRNQLFRDRDSEVDVLLQIGGDGISQEADNVLYDFPSDPNELFQYDCIVAFDPDWLALDETQIRLLERWVADEAGGLILVAGPVHTPHWSSIRRGNEPRADLIKGLYPVIFYSQGGLGLGLDNFGGEAAWPMQFTREGLEAEFLWLEDDAIASESAWAEFPGVYGYYAVKDPKPGARIYARFSDPGTSIDDQLPIYFAGQFYGAGRVFFEASGEIWRIRGEDPRYFEQFYTKLIRWASEGRLLRNSGSGLLLVDKERGQLGDHVETRAILTDAQRMPLTADTVSAMLIQPDSTRVALTLQKVKDASREGTYIAHFTALQEGDYRIELSPPESPAAELLTKTVKIRSTDLEILRPQRNGPLLRDLADKTGGAYYNGVPAAMGQGGTAPVANLLQPADQVSFISGSPDSHFDRRLMAWLMVLITGVLSIEWLIRRLGKLA